MSDETEQLELIPTEEELDFELREVSLNDLAHVETPIPPKRELIESLRLIGMLQPPIFREGPDGHLDIVIGRRRVAAARILQMERVKIFVAKTTAAVADVMTLAENAIRSANTVTEFEAIERLTKSGYDMRAIRAMTGMQIQTIKKRQALLRLVPELAEAFRAGRMTATVADGAAKLPTAVQRELAMSLAVKGKIAASDLHEVRQARAQATMQSDLFDALDDRDGEEPTPAGEEPIEAALAHEIQSVIERLPPYIYRDQRTVARSLIFAASALLDLAMGQAVEDGPGATSPSQSDVDETPHFAEMADFGVKAWRGELVREADPKYQDAPVEQPDRVFTLTPIVEGTVGTDDLPKGNPPLPPRTRKPRKKADAPFDPNMTDAKNAELIEEEDEFIRGFVG